MPKSSRRRDRRRNRNAHRQRALQSNIATAVSVPIVVSTPRYLIACAKAEQGDYDAAKDAFDQLRGEQHGAASQALIESDLGSIAAASGDVTTARQRYNRALT